MCRKEFKNTLSYHLSDDFPPPFHTNAQAQDTFNGDALWWVARLRFQIDLMLGEGKRVDAANALRHASQLFEVPAAGER
jgi:hypothetical protein